MRNGAQSELVKDETSFNIVGHLKACATHKDLDRGCKLHVYIQEHKLHEKNSYIGSTLVNMYAKCGTVAKAQQVFEELPYRNVVSWSALISGYVQQGHGEEALKWYESMQCEGHSPTAVTFTCALKACASIRALAKGEEIHKKIVGLGMLEKDVVLGSMLVDMYAKCGALAKAKKVLKALPVRNVVAWSALVAGYAKEGQGEEALKCFDSMLLEGHSPDAVTFICALKACGSIRAVAKGREIHDKICSLNMLDKNIVLGNALVDMYAKCGALAKAQQVLKELPTCSMISWSALIDGYVQQGRGEETLKCFDGMLQEGQSPDAVTFICALKACGNIRAAAKGKEIHDVIATLGMLDKDILLRSALVDMYAKCGVVEKAEEHFKELSIGAVANGEEIHYKLVRLGMLSKDVVLGSSLVDMYAKCGCLAKAQSVLEELPVRNVGTLSALIAGYSQQGQGGEALKWFDTMLLEGHTPDAITFACILKACGTIGAASKGRAIHEKIVSLDMLEQDSVLGCALVDMYTKCGVLAKAQQVLKELPVQDAVMWNAIIAGYVQQGQGVEALKCFDIMLCEGHSPNTVTYTCALKACGIVGAAAKGRDIHKKIVSLGMLEKDIMLGNTLVDMYAKCGTLTKAQQVLEGLPVRDVVTWSALIGGYSQQGQSLEALECFERMQSEGVKPHSISLTAVLNACSHSCLSDQAEAYFLGMGSKYGMQPELEHYCCMVDLFGRAAMFNEALSVIGKMPSSEGHSMWATLLGACRMWGEANVGRLAFEHAFHLQ